jgi:predicted  nucleic acid-binding Zn-ribbon protein
MNKIDLIIDALDQFITLDRHKWNFELVEQALASARKLRDAVEKARQDEREACAKFLESTDLSKAGEYTVFIANMLSEYVKAIRARGNT